MKGAVRLALLLSVLCFSCGRRYAEEDISPLAVSARDSLQNAEEDKQKRLMETNKVLLKKESERIVAYAERRGWQMEHLQGVFIQITDKGSGRGFSQGDKVAVEYDCELLNGTKVASSREDGVLNMIIGKGGEFPLGLRGMRHLLSTTKATAGLRDGFVVFFGIIIIPHVPTVIQ